MGYPISYIPLYPHYIPMISPRQPEKMAPTRYATAEAARAAAGTGT
jgi:hypothetical protein